jgi:hypothetical protein
MVNRPCLDCGELSPNTRCDVHQRMHDNARYAKRGSTTQRGYGSAYQQRRPQVLQDATHCRTCKREFTPDNPATAGHVRDLRDLPREQRQASAATAELMPQCAACNYGWPRG